MRTTIVLVTIALVFALCVMGQAPNQPKPLDEGKSSSPPPQPSATGAHEMTAADVESFLDGIVPLPPHIGLGGLYRLHLFRNRSARRLDLTLRAYEPRSEAASGDDETGLTTLASEIDSLELRYFGKAKGEETPNWRNEWQDQEELPSLILIKVRGEKIGVVWPELLISPRVKPVDWR